MKSKIFIVLITFSILFGIGLLSYNAGYKKARDKTLEESREYIKQVVIILSDNTSTEATPES